MLIVSNWKAYVEKKEDAKDLMATAKRLATKTRHKLVVLPPAPFIGLLSSGARSKVDVGAQDVSDLMAGAATGEVSAGALKQAGAYYALVGHSERRVRGETDERVYEKTVRALAAGLTPILCVGERVRDHNAAYLQELRAQIDSVFSRLTPKDRLKVVIAYEPVWAIGKTAAEAIHPSDLTEMVLYIQKVLARHLAEKEVSKVKILYGGSVEASSVVALAKGSRVDGFLVGRASTDAKTFSALIKALS